MTKLFVCYGREDACKVIIILICCVVSRMDLCYEKESALEGRLMTASSQLVDTDNYIYQLPGCQAFGGSLCCLLPCA